MNKCYRKLVCQKWIFWNDSNVLVETFSSRWCFKKQIHIIYIFKTQSRAIATNFYYSEHRQSTFKIPFRTLNAVGNELNLFRFREKLIDKRYDRVVKNVAKRKSASSNATGTQIDELRSRHQICVLITQFNNANYFLSQEKTL